MSSATAITPQPGAGVASAGNASGARATGLANDFGNFLKLLTTQLRNQDPLSPMDADKFTSQLVQFSAVEQAIQTNSKLGQLVGLLKASATTAALDFLGAHVTVDGTKMHVDSSGGKTRYTLPTAADNVAIRLFDASGRLVHATDGKTAAGDNVFTWDGKLNSGGRATSGVYRVEITAKDASGAVIPVTTARSSTVASVETRGDTIVLDVDSIPVPIDAVRNVRRQPAV